MIFHSYLKMSFLLSLSYQEKRTELKLNLVLACILLEQMVRRKQLSEIIMGWLMYFSVFQEQLLQLSWECVTQVVNWCSISPLSNFLVCFLVSFTELLNVWWQRTNAGFWSQPKCLLFNGGLTLWSKNTLRRYFINFFDCPIRYSSILSPDHSD